MPGVSETELVVPGRTYVYLGNVGAVAPLDVTTPMSATAWANVGNTTADSLAFSTEPEFEELQSAQSDFPVRRFQTTDSATVAVDLMQWSATNFRAAFGGGTVTTTGTAPNISYRFTPPRLGARKELACVIEVIDGDKRYRYVFPRTQQSEGVEMQLQKGAGSNLALRLGVVGGDAIDPWYLLTNDVAFAAAGNTVLT
jgi:hypothetical protein